MFTSCHASSRTAEREAVTTTATKFSDTTNLRGRRKLNVAESVKWNTEWKTGGGKGIKFRYYDIWLPYCLLYNTLCFLCVQWNHRSHIKHGRFSAKICHLSPSSIKAIEISFFFSNALQLRYSFQCETKCHVCASSTKLKFSIFNCFRVIDWR